jgi:hypothetical protein
MGYVFCKISYREEYENLVNRVSAAPAAHVGMGAMLV